MEDRERPFFLASYWEAGAISVACPGAELDLVWSQLPNTVEFSP